MSLSGLGEAAKTETGIEAIITAVLAPISASKGLNDQMRKKILLIKFR